MTRRTIKLQFSSFFISQIRYAVKREYAATAVDILARRLRLSFLNVQAAEEALPRVIEIMSEELGWSEVTTIQHFIERVKLGDTPPK